MEVNPTGEQALLILGEWGAAREWRAVLVDLKEGRELHALGEAGLVGGAAFSADGKRLLIGRGNVTSGLECVVYDTTTGRELGRLPGAGGGVALHPGGRLVAASRMEGSLTLFDLATRRSVASLYGVGEGDWIVTSAGSYDASQPNSPWLMTEISPEAATAASESLLEERRRPNLLSEVLAPLLD